MNPFRPGFGEYPEVRAGRTEVLRRWAAAFRPDTASHPAAKSILIGDRGLGKTVLLDSAHDIALHHGWTIAEANGVAEQPLHRRLINQLWVPPAHHQRTTTVDVTLGFVSASSTWTPPTEQPPTTLDDAIRIVMAASNAPTGILMMIDEMHDVPPAEIKQFGNSVQTVIRSGYRVGFVGAGLPTLGLGDPAAMPTFLARSWQPKLGYVRDDDIRSAFLETLQRSTRTCSRGVASLVAHMSGGVPYAMQVLGWELVEHTNPGQDINVGNLEEVVANAHDQIIAGLRIEYDLPPAHRRFLTAMSGPTRPAQISTITAALEKTHTQLSRDRNELIERGLIKPVGHGLLEYTQLGTRSIAASDPTGVDILARISRLDRI